MAPPRRSGGSQGTYLFSKYLNGEGPFGPSRGYPLLIAAGSVVVSGMEHDSRRGFDLQNIREVVISAFYIHTHTLSLSLYVKAIVIKQACNTGEGVVRMADRKNQAEMIRKGVHVHRHTSMETNLHDESPKQGGGGQQP